jgi:hypothetical protein
MKKKNQVRVLTWFFTVVAYIYSTIILHIYMIYAYDNIMIANYIIENCFVG